MATESITKEFVINDDQTFDILMKVIDEHKGRRKVIPSGRYEEGRRLLRELFPSEPEDPKAPDHNRLTANVDETDPAESAEILSAIGELEPDDLAITSVERVCLKKRPAGEALKYKGYSGTVEYDAEDGLLTGHIVGIRDSINYHGSSVEEIRSSFIDAVENYLQLCEEIKKAPDTHI